jgi:hypothetical protein
VSASRQTHPDPRAWEGWETPPGAPDKGLLELLAADAAGRATAMLVGSATGTEDPLIDAVRLLASASGTPHTARAARLTGISEDELRRLILAYRHGGTAGVSAALEATPCDADEMSAAVDEVRRRRTFAVGELSVDAGTITDAGARVRLRLGPDGRWYPFTLARKQWWPANGASTSAGAAYQTAVRARSLRGANG